MDGLAQALNNLNIVYTYHEHEGSEGASPNGCYTKVVQHGHVDSCYTQCTGTHKYGGYNYTENNGTIYYVKPCNVCGKDDRGTNTSDVKCTNKTLSCNIDSSILNYELGCGKTEDTIESVTIVY